MTGVGERSNGGVAAALARLREAADRVHSGWSPASWLWSRADGSDREVAGFAELDLAPDSRQVVRTRLDLPARLHGIDLDGDPLQLTVTSILPVRVSLDGRVLVDEGRPAIAAGPALVEAVDALQPGNNGELRVEIVRPASHGAGEPWVNWVGLRFTTPGLRERFDQLDLAWARLRLAGELAGTDEESAALEAAARLVPDELLEVSTGDLADALSAMAEALEPLAARAARVDVHVIGHCHIDLAWLWTWDDTREVIKRDIRSVLGILRDYPEVTFTHSQPAGYELIRTEEPELFAEIQRHVREGRWEPATAQWVEGDTNLASGESTVSQLLEGVSFTREHLGVSPRVCLAPDTFGHAANTPQLVADAGVQIYYHHRCNPGGRHGRWPAYWWEGLDGTRVLAVSTRSYNGTLTAGAIAEAAVEAVRADLPAALLFVGVGDHGGGPTREGYDRLRVVGRANAMPTAFCSTISAYADELLTARVRLPVHRGESPTIFEGCYTTHADAKQANRDGENRLTTAETLAALAGLPRDPDLTPAWRDLCFHQFHDILDGSAIREAYDQTRQDHQRQVEVSEQVLDAALGVLHRGLGDGVAVTNPLGHDRTDVVTVPGVSASDAPVVVDADGTRTPGQVTADGLVFVARVPAFGTSHYTVTGASAEPDGELAVRPEGGSAEAPTYWRVETTHFSAAVRRDCGILTSFVDKRVDRELVAYGMRRMSDYTDAARPDLGLNVFQVVEERPHPMSSWHYDEVHAEHSWVDGATTEVVEDGRVRVILRVRHAFRASSVVEDIVFYRDLPRVDFLARVDWQEPTGPEHGVPNLKVAFAPDVEGEAWFDVPYGAVRRRANGQQVPALGWADVGDVDYGVAVLNDSTYGHDVLGNRMRLTLVRTAYAPDPRSDRGDYAFRYSLVPHPGDWRAAEIPLQAAGFNQPLVVRQPADGTASTVPHWQPRVESAGLVSMVLRVARTGHGTVIRLAERVGRATPVRLSGLPPDTRVWKSDVTEARLAPVGVGPAVSLTLSAWEVRTLVVDPAD